MTKKDLLQHYIDRKKCTTDYPIHSFGDKAGEVAPIRDCYLTEIPIDKYAEVIVIGENNNYSISSIKIGYLYSRIEL